MLERQSVLIHATSRRPDFFRAGHGGGEPKPFSPDRSANATRMIQLSSAGKHFGSKTLFEALNWVVGARDRVGLVGANGTGKSTLLKLLAGMETLDKGSFSAAKDTTSGYLPQDGLSLSGRTVLEECLSVFGHLLEIEKETSLAKSLADFKINKIRITRLHHSSRSAACKMSAWQVAYFPPGNLDRASSRKRFQKRNNDGCV